MIEEAIKEISKLKAPVTGWFWDGGGVRSAV